MKILWICNNQPAAVGTLIGDTKYCFGGWLDETCEGIISNKNNELLVMFPHKNIFHGENENLKYASFSKKFREERFIEVLKDFRPDVVHIWGTEMTHTFDAVAACEKLGILNRTAISIQGMVSIYGKFHYIEGLPPRIVNRFTLRDFLKMDNIRQGRKYFIKLGETELLAIKKAKHIIGRTDWDRAITEQYNSNAKYHFCNETLRGCFYGKNWSLSTCQRHAIFVSQCGYPIKGFHFLLEAMPEILKKYPDAHIYTTGQNLVNLSLKQRLRISSYALYIYTLIKKYKLQKSVTFLGRLSAEQMLEQYMNANVFVSASTVENSPNSVGEAMLVGCPVVSSDVGGVKNMLIHGEEGFVYHSTAPYMLAYYVNQIFAKDTLANKFSRNAKIHAEKTHDRQENYEQLMRIYQEILDLEVKQ